MKISKFGRRWVIAGLLAATAPLATVSAADEATVAAPSLKLVYRLSGNSEQWPEEKRRRIVEAMDGAAALYNHMGEFPKSITASYNAGVPTADGNYNGNIRFGGSINKRVALHELGHVLGVGQHPRWWGFIKDGKWTGPYAIAQLKALDGPDAVLNVDGQHFWPYGLNYDSESSPENDRRHVLMVAAFRRDLGIKTGVALSGRIGVGTQGTQAEFKDITVIKGNKTLFASDFAKGQASLADWKTTRGQWQVLDGALRQTGTEGDARALVGDPKWSDYTLSLKARKISGREGFRVFFGSPDDDNTASWNLGGRGNTRYTLEVPDGVSSPATGQIETGRWYDIKVEVKGSTAKAYLDGKLLQQAAR
jgi:hypothetical protein